VYFGIIEFWDFQVFRLALGEVEEFWVMWANLESDSIKKERTQQETES